MLVTAISPWLTVCYLGPERYGIWVTVSTSVAMISITDIGGANSLTNPISHAYTQGDRQFARRAYGPAFWISTVLA